MTFAPKRANPKFIGLPIHGARYTLPTGDTYHISTVKSLRYLGVYLDHRLDWTHHVTIMANRARSTIRGVSLLGNSVRGLDFLNWRKVYNALIIPVLTYGAQVWYTGKGQKGLIQWLQVAQNEGLRKMTGVFKTTPIDPLHNLTRVPPISYVLPKLMHTYSNRLQGLPARAKVRTILSEDQCRYWPDYINPMTNLWAAFRAPSISPPRVEGQTSHDRWNTPRLLYLDPTPNHLVPIHHRDLSHPEPNTLHIFIATAPSDPHVAVYLASPSTQGTMRGLTQTQALCRAVKEALITALPHHTHDIVLWICHKPLLNRLTTLLPHSDTLTVLATCRLLYDYLTIHSSASVELRSCEQAWLGSRQRVEIKRIAITEEPPALPEAEMEPKAAMWARIQWDYTLSTHPSHIACATPDGNKPPPAIRAAIAHRNRLICSTIVRFTVAHCFDANYSDQFRPGANDTTECLCNPTQPPHPHGIPRRHTRHHVLFHC
jgi:hypothetical protein